MRTAVHDAVVIEGSTQGTLALSTTGAETAALREGIYDVWCTADCFIKVGTTASDVTTSNGYVLLAGNVIPVLIREDRKLGGVVGTGTATLSYHKTGN